MSMHVEHFTLRQLAHLSGVTPRTVHFYIQQGLLRPAGSPGPGAKYGEGHLARLRLIRRLQREHQPLADIRKRLDTLDDEAIRTAVAELAADQPPEPASALDYVRRLLAPDQARASARIGHTPLRAVTPLGPPARPATAQEDRFTWGSGLFALRADGARARSAEPAQAGRPAVSERSQWERYVLAPDIELHVRRPLSRDQNRRVERLLALARTTLNEELP